MLGLQLAFFFGGLSYIEFIVCGMRDNVDSMVDHPFNWALPINAYVQAQEDAAPDSRSLLVTSLLMADTLFVMSCAIVAMYLILCADDITVIAAMLCNHSARALCFLLVELPKPERIIWRTPGFPDTENDYFFSGHIGLPIIAAPPSSRCIRTATCSTTTPGSTPPTAKLRPTRRSRWSMASR